MTPKVATSSAVDFASGSGFRVVIRNLSATRLPSMDRNGYSDPYVCFDFDTHRRFRTSVIKECLNPVWKEFTQTFHYVLEHASRSSMSARYLTFSVYDHNRIRKDDYIGEGRIPLYVLATGPPRHQLTLRDGGRPRGVIHFECVMEEIGDVNVSFADVTCRMVVGSTAVRNGHVEYFLTTGTAQLEVHRQKAARRAQNEVYWQEWDTLNAGLSLRDLCETELHVRLFDSLVVQHGEQTRALVGTGCVQLKDLLVNGSAGRNSLSCPLTIALHHSDGHVVGHISVSTFSVNGLPNYAPMPAGLHRETGIYNGVPLFDWVPRPRMPLISDDSGANDTTANGPSGGSPFVNASGAANPSTPTAAAANESPLRLAMRSAGATDRQRSGSQQKHSLVKQASIRNAVKRHSSVFSASHSFVAPTSTPSTPTTPTKNASSKFTSVSRTFGADVDGFWAPQGSPSSPSSAPASPRERMRSVSIPSAAFNVQPRSPRVIAGGRGGSGAGGGARQQQPSPFFAQGVRTEQHNGGGGAGGEWERRVDQHGRPFYYNRRTQQQSWLMPNTDSMVSTDLVHHVGIRDRSLSTAKRPQKPSQTPIVTLPTLPSELPSAKDVQEPPPPYEVAVQRGRLHADNPAPASPSASPQSPASAYAFSARRFVSNDRNAVQVIKNGTRVCYVADTVHGRDVVLGVARTQQPLNDSDFRNDLFYYEVRVAQLGQLGADGRGNIGIGYSVHGHTRDTAPHTGGQSSSQWTSFLYCSRTGHFVRTTSVHATPPEGPWTSADDAPGDNAHLYGPMYAAEGDTIGCALNARTGELWFTHNGVFLGSAWQGLDIRTQAESNVREWFPTLFIQSVETVVDVVCTPPFTVHLEALRLPQTHKLAYDGPGRPYFVRTGTKEVSWLDPRRGAPPVWIAHKRRYVAVIDALLGENGVRCMVDPQTLSRETIAVARSIPRAAFLPPLCHEDAYENKRLHVQLEAQKGGAAVTLDMCSLAEMLIAMLALRLEDRRAFPATPLQVLDVGCGSGHLSAMLGSVLSATGSGSGRGGTLTSIDTSAEVVAFARRNMCEFVMCSGFKLWNVLLKQANVFDLARSHDFHGRFHRIVCLATVTSEQLRALQLLLCVRGFMVIGVTGALLRCERFSAHEFRCTVLAAPWRQWPSLVPPLQDLQADARTKAKANMMRLGYAAADVAAAFRWLGNRRVDEQLIGQFLKQYTALVSMGFREALVEEALHRHVDRSFEFIVEWLTTYQQLRDTGYGDSEVLATLAIHGTRLADCLQSLHSRRLLRGMGYADDRINVALECRGTDINGLVDYLGAWTRLANAGHADIDVHEALLVCGASVAAASMYLESKAR